MRIGHEGVTGLKVRRRLEACTKTGDVGRAFVVQGFTLQRAFSRLLWRSAVAIILFGATTACSKKKTAVMPAPVVIAAPEKSSAPVKRARRTPASRPAQERETTPPLESVRTQQERREMMELVKGSITRAEANVAALRKRSLTSDNARELGRVDSFLRQARLYEEANDLVTARQYAQRAELLSHDLLNR